jgi:hypothetical protein
MYGGLDVETEPEINATLVDPIGVVTTGKENVAK